MGSTPEREIGIAGAIARVVARQDLSESQAHAVARTIMAGEATPSQIAGLLVALRMKGETVEEITGFVSAMRERVDRVPVDGGSVVDSCGTGGDGAGTFNISTVVAFVAAGAGCRVAKHGNRSVSSRCGSSEVLEHLGISPDIGPKEAARCIEEFGAAFLFAPRYHRAARHALTPRREIGIRSIFNIVGPLTNPAGAQRQLMGVFDPGLTEPAARVLARLGSIHCMVVHGSDGLDEITLAGPTRVSELRNGDVRSYELDPATLGFSCRTADEIRGGDTARNAQIATEVLRGRAGAPREIVLLNAAALLYVGGTALDLREGLARATESIDSGRAWATLEALRGRSDQCMSA